ncbi:FAD-binding domain protein [Ceratobasidium sp. AG-Ba]|nr:FAD-binding domain protein [Ceratobasidium sp. AG-Ba]
MKLSQALAFSICVSTGALAQDLCDASQDCWPSLDVWSAFNASVGGRLLAPRPPAWPCHDPNYDEAACQEVKANWGNSFWRSNQTGAMQDPIWESPGCGISTPRNVTCDQGFVPKYAVAAKDAEDVSKAVLFAGQHRLRLVVKNTGHDYLGRSSGEGSFSIWTHLLKGVKFTDSFMPIGCSNTTSGLPAVTLGAAEQWRDVYQAANDHNRTIVGGAARSVGAAGGWVHGGGHSPLGFMYGMGVDNVLQFRIVKPNGQLVVANACQNRDLFWALRGGGGSTWGVTIDVTYKTHPALDSMVGISIDVNVTSPEKFKSLAETFLRAVPSMNEQGVNSYSNWVGNATASFLFHQTNSPSIDHTNQTLAPLWDWLSNNPDSQVFTSAKYHPTFFDFFQFWIGTDVIIGVRSWLSGRLVSKKAMQTRPEELAKLVIGGAPVSMNLVAGGTVSKADPASTGLNPQWRNDALMSWNFGNFWDEGTSIRAINAIKETARNLSLALGRIAGLDYAAYLNEADPEEPLWQKAFFGDHYGRLLRIKRDIDPTGLFTCNRCVGSDL